MSSAGASFAAAVNCGTFHGTMAATTPTGSRRTRSLPRAPSRVSSYVKLRATLIAESQTIIAASACTMTPEVYGVPFSLLMTRAISSCRTANASLIFVMISMRSSRLIRGQGPSSKARRATATARSTSAGAACGTRPKTSPVCGETTSMTSLPSGSVNSPPMNSCPCSTSSVMAGILTHDISDGVSELIPVLVAIRKGGAPHTDTRPGPLAHTVRPGDH